MGGIRLYSGYSNKNIRLRSIIRGSIEEIPKEDIVDNDKSVEEEIWFDTREDSPVIFADPVWVSKDFIGSFEGGEEVYIQLEYIDSDDVIESFILEGELPEGLMLNMYDGSISGYIDTDVSKIYTFIIKIRTIQNKYISEEFTLSTVAYSNEIVWETPSDLGYYNTGDSVSVPIEAKSVQTPK